MNTDTYTNLKNNKIEYVKDLDMDNTIIMSDYTLGWYNNNQDDEYLRGKIKLLNQVKRFVVIIPKTKRIFGLINVPFSIMMTNKDLLKGDDGSSVYRIYEHTKSVVIKSNKI